VVADKGADAFVRACAATLPALSGWRAEMIGADRFWANSTTTPFQKELQPVAQAAGIALRGYLPHAQLMQAMARASIVIVPSRWPEPFGLTALEAMASGAALICSPRGGLPEVAGEAALYAEPDEPGTLEAAILRLAGDAGLRARLAHAGFAQARLFDAGQARIRLRELREAALAT
jgi:UDP-glucose:(glucosyl)LPS alpha-1,2-glucosyltransferase